MDVGMPGFPEAELSRRSTRVIGFISQLRIATLTSSFLVCTVMTASDELEYLKSLVNQLNDKIHALEKKAKQTVSSSTPAQQLRTILIGPPGAGEVVSAAVFQLVSKLRNLIIIQVKVRKLLELGTNSASATWLRETSFENKSPRRLNWESRPRKLWMLAV
jgi:hypothetical protein